MLWPSFELQEAFNQECKEDKIKIGGLWASNYAWEVGRSKDPEVA